MTPTDTLLLSLLILFAAALYSSVGHGGASGYLAAMALFGLAPPVMRPTALCLNILVSTLGTYRFWRAGHFRWRAFWPFAVASVPLAFVGGALTLPAAVYKQLVGFVLIFAAARLFLHTPARPKAHHDDGRRDDDDTPPDDTRNDRDAHGDDDDAPEARGDDGWHAEGASRVRSETRLSSEARDADETRDAPIWASMLLGAVIGLLSGLTGVGGGIFLSPLLLLAGWAGARRTAAVSAAFILVNSAAGLLGNPAGLKSVSAALPYFALAALVGGLAGTEFGSRRLPPLWIRRLLAAVLVVAGLKLILA